MNKKKSSWVVYIIETSSGKYYTGITTDLKRRFSEHLSRGKGAKFFNTSLPKEIKYVENVENRSIASKREAAIKKMTRAMKKELIDDNQA